jgi:hypothetical protein
MDDEKLTDSQRKAAVWPSVEAQLDEAEGSRGSALEQLIRDNQDFHLLQPQEAHDAYDIPLWLRVYWRKAHPDVQLSSVNPGASYPEVLETIHKWMLAHPDSPAGPSKFPTANMGGMR